MKAQISLMVHTVRTEGPRSAFKKFGWKFVAFIVGYYLIRDTILYVILPFLAIHWMWA